MIYKKNKKQYGDEFKDIQRKLGTKADGYFGPKTLAKVKEFQRKNGLNVDGIIGPKTLAKLYPNNLIQGDNIPISKIKGTNPIGEDFNVKTQTEEYINSKINSNPSNLASNKSSNTNINSNNANISQNTGYNNFQLLQQKQQAVEQAQKDVQNIEQKLQTLSASHTKDINDATFNLTKDLIAAKDRLRKIQDDSLSFQLDQNEKLRGEGGTKSDYQHMTGQALRDYSVQSTIESRNLARLSETYNNIKNIKTAIDNEYKVKADALNFEYKLKMNRLNQVQTKYWDIMDKQDQRNWEKTKMAVEFENQKKLIQIKNGYTAKQALLSKGLGLPQEVREAISNDNLGYDKKVKALNEAFSRGELDLKTYNEMKGNLIEEDRMNKEERDILDTKINDADYVIKQVNRLLEMDKNFDLNDYEGVSGSFWSLFRGTDASIVEDVIKNIQSNIVIGSLNKMKGPKTDKDIEVLIRGINDLSTDMPVEDMRKSLTEIYQKMAKVKNIYEAEKNKKMGIITPQKNNKTPNDYLNIQNETPLDINKGTTIGLPQNQVYQWNKATLNNPLNKYPTVIDFRNTSNPIIQKAIQETDPNQLQKLLQGISKVESSGNYFAISNSAIPSGRYKGQRALGKYQVMEGNIPQWGKEVGINNLTPDVFLKNPAIQDLVVARQFAKNLKKYGNLDDAISVWFTGQPYRIGKNRRDTNISGKEYVSRVKKYIT